MALAILHDRTAIDLAACLNDPAKLNKQLESIVNSLNSQRGQRVLLCSDQYGANYTFQLSDAELFPEKEGSKPFISLRALGPVYKFKSGTGGEGHWERDNSPPWGRNFFPEKLGYLIVE